ncbi:MAG: ABC transporter permease [Chloroflexi bacterium]|nr:ABC transporter permease [Chloroflexota bacterium]
MNVRITVAVVRRVLRQLARDRRSLALILAAPPLLLWLMDGIFTNAPGVFNRVGPLMLGLFPFTLIFVVTSIALLRERTQGTLDRLMASPLGRGDLVVGYAAAFALVALVQAAITLTVGLGLLDLPTEGSLWLTVVLVLAQALLGVALGLFLSAFARNEFQAVQFLPAVVLPQIVLAGLLMPVDRLPRGLEIASRMMPLTYAFEALDRIMREGRGLGNGRVALDLTVLVCTLVALLVAGSLTLRRTEG